MKTNFKIAWLIALLAGMPLLLSAQEKDRSSLPREVLSPEKVAKRETDEMKKQLQLTEKQYKKIYKPSNPQLSSSASFLRLNVLSSLN